MNLIDRDLKHIWHPCSQMQDYETFPPLVINDAQGPYLFSADGKRIIDAISSWWCKSLGHRHPVLTEALITQAQKSEHVILANTTNETIVELSEKLCSINPQLDKVFYASDGSCAVEIALKMSVHAQQLRGQGQRQHFAALSNGFHGETCLTLAVSDVGLYKEPYTALLPDVTMLGPLPYVSGTDDPLWHDASSYWPAIEKQLEAQKDSLAAIIFEPILQGAGGMQLYSPDLLKHLRAWADAHDVFLIADECLTGLGRLGHPFACDIAHITPDFLCLSKNLTAGYLPMSATLTRTNIYDLFYDDYARNKAFMHSHTHSGNTLAAAVALAYLKQVESENIYVRVKNQHSELLNAFTAVAKNTGKLTNIRSYGAMVAGDLITDQPRAGYAVYQEAVKRGALLRPLGNTIYWLLPLNTESSTIHELAEITQMAIEAVA